ncbi:hypothetical protein Tco_1539417 [Tanacetum coccineum]
MQLYEHRLDNLPSEKARKRHTNSLSQRKARLIRRVRGWDAGDGAPSSVGGEKSLRTKVAIRGAVTRGNLPNSSGQILKKAKKRLHTGTETRPGLPRGAAVGNLGQWAKARSSNIARGKTGGQVVLRMTGRRRARSGESGESEKVAKKWRNALETNSLDSLGPYRRWGAKAWGANRIRYPGSPCRAAWLSSARVVRCLVKSYNERNPRDDDVELTAEKTGSQSSRRCVVTIVRFSNPRQNGTETTKRCLPHSRRTAVNILEEVGYDVKTRMAFKGWPHTSYNGKLQWERQAVRRSENPEDCLSFGLFFFPCNREHEYESLVIADQHAAVNMYSNPVHTVRQHPWRIGVARKHRTKNHPHELSCVPLSHKGFWWSLLAHTTWGLPTGVLALPLVAAAKGPRTRSRGESENPRIPFSLHVHQWKIKTNRALRVKGSVYVVTVPSFQRCLEDRPDAAERRPGSGFPTGRGAGDGHLKAHHDLQATPARPGKATRLGVRGSIVHAASGTSYSSFLKAGGRDLFFATEKKQSRFDSAQPNDTSQYQ